MPRNEDLNTLFCTVAPSYSSAPILSHLKKTFSTLTKEEFDVRTAECLKFLYLRSVSGRGFIPLSSEVDEIWHAFILQTQSYADFCQALPSQTFIHHNSISIEDYTKQVSRERSVERLLEWIPAYIKHFGQFTEKAASYWMIIQLLKKEFNYSLDEINALH